MKKENKILAQQKRAQERKKNAMKNKLLPICKVGLPILIFVVFVGIIVANPSPSEESDNDTSANTSTENNASTDTSTLLTDTSLTIKDGDTVNIDYVGSIDGVEFSGGNTQGQGADLTIGSGMYIDDFEEQLIGAHPGDTVDVYATFPENYGNEDLKGKEALFVVKVNGIYE